MHRIRRALDLYSIRKSILISVVEFISKLGGSTAPVEGAMIQTESTLGEVERHYLAHDFQVSLQLAEESVRNLKQTENLAAAVKNQNLLWIYLIEWTVLTSTSLVAGVMVWSLMVRRVFYSEVRTTRLTKLGVDQDPSMGK